MFAVGVFDDVNVSVPEPCAEQYTPAVVYTLKDDGSGEIITVFDAVTPVQLTVPNDVVTVICWVDVLLTVNSAQEYVPELFTH